MGRDTLRDNTAEHLLQPYLHPDGSIVIPDDVTVTSFLMRNAADQQDQAAYRFVDYSTERDGQPKELSWKALVTTVQAVGARLQQVTNVGDRVAIVAPQGLAYVSGFFAAIHAGTVAVPLFVPTLGGHGQRLKAVLADSRPTVILTTTEAAESVRKFLRTFAPSERPRLIAIDAVPDSLAATFTEIPRGADDLAYLQYTSGSTRSPAGVEITHRAVCTNVTQMILAGGLDMGTRSVSWLPLFHDMGLIMIMFPALCGGHITLMDPMAFVRRPYRWIKQLAIESAHGRTFAAAPNFAFTLAAERGLPPEGESVDLSNVVGLLNGSEPVSMTAIEAFLGAFAPYGLPATAVKPSYGLAEATLSVASIAPTATASAAYFDRTSLTAGTAVQVAPDNPDAVSYVSCGQAVPSQWVVVVDAEHGAEVPDGTVGEIWLHGENIGRGYWGNEAATRRVFGNKLECRLENSHAAGAADNCCWLATGDLGVYVEGELYLTGRIKDLVIVDGRNHYPQDIETTVGEACAAVRSGYVAAFTVDAPLLADTNPANTATGEQLVIVAERAARARGAEDAADTIRAAVSRLHQLTVADVRLVPAGAIPRTTSGKLARSACRADYLAGRFS